MTLNLYKGAGEVILVCFVKEILEKVLPEDTYISALPPALGLFKGNYLKAYHDHCNAVS